MEYLGHILRKANERGDSWASNIKLQIQTGDLVAAEGRYHRRCAQLFYMDRQHPSTEIRPPSGRPLDADKHEAFDQLCEYLVTKYECQCSSAEIIDIYKDYRGKFDRYSPRWLTLKLKEHYCDGFIVTSLAGQTKIYSFPDAGHKILYDKWKS